MQQIELDIHIENPTSSNKIIEYYIEKNKDSYINSDYFNPLYAYVLKQDLTFGNKEFYLLSFITINDKRIDKSDIFSINK